MPASLALRTEREWAAFTTWAPRGWQTRRPLASAKTASVVARCARDGVLVGRTANTTPGLDNVVMLAPPFVISEDEADELASTLERAIREELSETV